MENHFKALGSARSVILSAVYPIGSIYMSTNSVNPSELFGGVWEVFAQGRTIIGAGINEGRSFANLQEGGEYSHTLTVDEMPSHTHTQDAHTHTGQGKNFEFWFSCFEHKDILANSSFPGGYFQNSGNSNVELSQLENHNNTASIGSGDSWGYRKVKVSWNHIPAINDAVAVNKNTGGGQAHNVLQPYIVTYIWTRVG